MDDLQLELSEMFTSGEFVWPIRTPTSKSRGSSHLWTPLWAERNSKPLTDSNKTLENQFKLTLYKKITNSLGEDSVADFFRRS